MQVPVILVEVPMGDRGMANNIHSLEQDILTGFVVIKQKGGTVMQCLETVFPIMGARSCILPDSSYTCRLGQDTSFRYQILGAGPGI